jgi:hypothetical protein
MALRKPLVIVSGEIEQLQAGDDLNVPITGTIDITLTNDEASPVVIGAPVYSDANDGFKKAKADAGGTALVIGLVSQSPSITNATAGTVGVSGILTATTAQWDAVTGQVGGLTFNTRYYLSAATSGLLTITAPTTTGNYVVEIGQALSTTEMSINIKKRILL